MIYFCLGVFISGKWQGLIKKLTKKPKNALKNLNNSESGKKWQLKFGMLLENSVIFKFW